MPAKNSNCKVVGAYNRDDGDEHNNACGWGMFTQVEQ